LGGESCHCRTWWNRGTLREQSGIRRRSPERRKGLQKSIFRNRSQGKESCTLAKKETGPTSLHYHVGGAGKRNWGRNRVKPEEGEKKRGKKKDPKKKKFTKYIGEGVAWRRKHLQEPLSFKKATLGNRKAEEKKGENLGKGRLRSNLLKKNVAEGKKGKKLRILYTAKIKKPRKTRRGGNDKKLGDQRLKKTQRNGRLICREGKR